MKYLFYKILLLQSLFPLLLFAQESETAYNFLRIPMSAHSAALGGENISLVEDDPSLVYNNPAMLSSIDDKTLGLNFMSYMQGAVIGGASYSKAYSDKLSWGVMAQYVNYGSMKETDENNTELGTFHANDIALQGVISYQLAERLYGGLTAKWIGSYIGNYSSMAVGVDLGLNFFDMESDFSLSAVAKNLGGQLSAYEEEHDRMPFDLQMGLTKGFQNMPARIHITMVGLTEWDYGFFDHFVFGVDLLLGKQFYIAGGYNCRRAHDMKIYDDEDEKGSSHGAGLSFGAGLNIKRFSLDIAWAKYHVSSHSLVFNMAYNL